MPAKCEFLKTQNTQEGVLSSQKTFQLWSETKSISFSLLHLFDDRSSLKKRTTLSDESHPSPAYPSLSPHLEQLLQYGTFKEIRDATCHLDSSWLSSNRIAHLDPSPLFWSKFSFSKLEDMPLLSLVCIRVRDTDAAKILALLYPPMMSERDTYECTRLAAARGNFITFSIMFDCWERARDSGFSVFQWGNILDCAVLRSDRDGLRIAATLVKHGELVKQSCKERFLESLLLVFLQGYATSARSLLDSSLLIDNEKCHLWLAAACGNRIDGGNLIRLLQATELILEIARPTLMAIFKYACAKGNGDSVGALLDVFPNLRSDFEGNWLCDNRVDPLGVVKAVCGRDATGQCKARSIRMEFLSVRIRQEGKEVHLETMWALLRHGEYRNLGCAPGLQILQGIGVLWEEGSRREALLKLALAEDVLNEGAIGDIVCTTNPSVELVRLLIHQQRVNPFVRTQRGNLPIEETTSAEIKAELQQYMQWNPLRKGVALAWYGPIVYQRIFTFACCMVRLSREAPEFREKIPRTGVQAKIIGFILDIETY